MTISIRLWCVERRWTGVRLLHMGHLCADKGTPQLLTAFAALRRNHPELELELVGECLPPFTSELLEKTDRSSLAFAPRSSFRAFSLDAPKRRRLVAQIFLFSRRSRRTNRLDSSWSKPWPGNCPSSPATGEEIRTCLRSVPARCVFQSLHPVVARYRGGFGGSSDAARQMAGVG